MTQFVIYGAMDENKNLTLEGDIQLCQGENQTTQLQINVPNFMATDCDFYFEFLCPHNLWVSPKATAVAGESYTEVSYLLPSAILQEEGNVLVQLVARKRDDQCILYKSSLSTDTSITVRRSVNASANTPQMVDFFGEASTMMQEVQEKMQSLSAVAFSGSYNDLTSRPARVDLVSKQLVNGAKTFSDLRVMSSNGSTVKLVNDNIDTSRVHQLTLPRLNNALHGYNSRRVAMTYFYSTGEYLMSGGINQDSGESVEGDCMFIPFWEGSEITIYLKPEIDNAKINKVTFNLGELAYQFDDASNIVCISMSHFKDEGFLGVSVNGKPIGFTFEYDWDSDFVCPYILLQMDLYEHAGGDVYCNVLVK